MNRFEAHPRKTLAVVLFLILMAVLAAIEMSLSAFHKELGLAKIDGEYRVRYLRLREWPPNSSAVYKAPEVRKNDPLGPVDETYELGIDKNGFIEPSVVHERPDLEIAFLGGSTTECLYVRPNARFPYLVAQHLEKTTSLKINALNAGKSGNHALHSVVAYIAKVAPRRPAYAVLMHATNDLGVLNSQSTYWNEKPGIEIVLDDTQVRRNGPVTRFVRKMREMTVPYTSRVVRNGLDAAGTGISGLVTAVFPRPDVAKDRGKVEATSQPGDPVEQERVRREAMRESFEPALRTFVRSARAWGSQPVLMTQVLVQPRKSGGPAQEGEFLSPEKLRQGNFDSVSFDSAHGYANALIRHVALGENAILIDLANARQWTKEDVYDGLHFTETGSRRVAEIVSRALEKKISGKQNLQASGNLKDRH